MTGPRSGDARPLRLRKFEGAGNDFLILADLDDAVRLTASQVQALCDRHHGVGADGIIRVLAGPPGTDVRMELRNADGSPAEMSGNGIRCLAHFAVAGGLVPGPAVAVATDAGVRRVELRTGDDGGVAAGSVTMGGVALGDELDPGPLVDAPGPAGPGVLARRVDAGNPHLVVVAPSVAPGWVTGWAAAVDAATPGGTNVELVTVDGPGAMTLSVWERGAGATLACGTGTTASAAAAEAWGLVDLPVRVANPGGTLWVERRGGELVLGGPSRLVADVEVSWSSLANAVLAVERHRAALAGAAGAAGAGSAPPVAASPAPAGEGAP